MRRSGQFRDDFYYRLCSDTITVPMLRQRVREDPREQVVMSEHILTRMVGDSRQQLVSLILDTLRRDLPPITHGRETSESWNRRCGAYSSPTATAAIPR